MVSRYRVLLFLLLLPLVGGGESDAYEISWYTVDGGGVMASTGGDFTLSATIGQPDAVVLAGGGFELQGGFWVVDPSKIFCDGFESGNTAAWSGTEQ